MVTTIRILRKKCHDIECIYVLEFLKLIGCLVFDRVFLNDLPEDFSQILSEDELYENYDVNICYGILEDMPKGTARFEYIKPEDSKDQKKNAVKFLNELVKKVWFDNNETEDKAVCSIKELYNTKKIFNYLYNKGSLKFIREYNSSNKNYSDKTNIKDLREYMCEHMYLTLLQFYKDLITENSFQKKDPVYLQFAKINLAQDLNETRALMGNGRAFRTDYMLDTLNEILENHSGMIRCYYLAGVISNFDNRYLVDSYSYYQTIMDIAKEIDLPRELLGFIYYQMGKCLEKKQLGNRSAYEAYSNAYKSNPYMMRALYKLAEIEHGIGDYEKAVKHSNEVIHVLLNGYLMKDAMPGQQLYAYKSMVLLGDIYQAKGRHELAIKCYSQGIELAKTKSSFYDIWDDSKSNMPLELVQKMCMPVQPIYYRMINCAAMCNDLCQSAEYYRMLRDERK